MEVGEGLLEATNQGEHSKHNSTEIPIVENDLEEQATDKQQENNTELEENNQEQVVAPAMTNYMTASGRAS